MIRKTKDVEKFKEQLEQAKKQAQEYLAGWKRTQADFINYRRRQEKRQGELLRFANQDLILDILPILDSFERAINEIPEQEDSVWLEGVKKIKEKFEKILEEKGLERIETKGVFSHELHEAIEIKPAKKLRPGTIIRELAPGYKLGGKVIRAAKVKVAK